MVVIDHDNDDFIEVPSRVIKEPLLLTGLRVTDSKREWIKREIKAFSEAIKKGFR